MTAWLSQSQTGTSNRCWLPTSQEKLLLIQNKFKFYYNNYYKFYLACKSDLQTVQVAGFYTSKMNTLLSKIAEYRFRQPKSVEDEERCVLNAIPKSTGYKNKWAARIFEEWGKARFPKVATLEPGGLFKE